MKKKSKYCVISVMGIVLTACATTSIVCEHGIIYPGDEYYGCTTIVEEVFQGA